MRKQSILSTCLLAIIISAAIASATAAESHDSIVTIMKKAADYQLELQAKSNAIAAAKTSGTIRGENGWIRSTFYTGILALHAATQDPKYLEAAVKWANDSKWTPDQHHPRHADFQCCGQVYCELYAIKPDPARIAPIEKTFQEMMKSPRRGREDWWWCDSLFMAPPVLARLASVTGNKDYDRFLNDMYWDSKEFLYDPSECLFYRDKNFFNKKTKNGKKVFWSRGNGWVVAGLARIIEKLPPDDPHYKDFVKLFQDMMTRLAGLQQPDGFWYPSLLDADDFHTSETSGTGFYTFATAWGINHHILNRSKFLPVAQKGWAALESAITPEGRLGYVQGVAGAPGPVKPDGTQEYAVGGFLLAGTQMLELTGGQGTPHAYPLAYDFGSGAVSTGHTSVKAGSTYSKGAGFGWVGATPLADRNRGTTDPLRGDFVMGHSPADFRIDVKTGAYQMKLIMGDQAYGNHELQVTVNRSSIKYPLLKAEIGEYTQLQANVTVSADGILIVGFSSPTDNWVINSIELIPLNAASDAAPVVSSVRMGKTPRGPANVATVDDKDAYGFVADLPDLIAPYVAKFHKDVTSAPSIKNTGLTRADYLKLIAGNVDFWKKYQDANGAIIDPYMKKEWQYSTPCFALSATALVVYADRKDLLDPACKAMDWACHTLSIGQAATHHEDFFSPQIAHALPLLKPLVPAERYNKWANDMKVFNPFKTYHAGPGGGNWNVVALSGEWLFHKLGLRPDITFIKTSLVAQAHMFKSGWGQYLEGPMAYDLFPRLWAGDMLSYGKYDGPFAKELNTLINRGALSSLFIQSPSGELPLGHRSAHHQWNEAEQAVTYEIQANRYAEQGDMVMASAFKRGAHLALQSMFRWQRPSGEMWVVKNKVDPALRHGFEGYSGNSQYNLLPMAMLSIAYQHAATTENIPEGPAPADVGGFVITMTDLHKVFANAGGMYAEIETNANSHYDETGLVRVHKTGMNPQLGPSDTISAESVQSFPAGPRYDAAIGPVWQTPDGTSKSLAQMRDDTIHDVNVKVMDQAPKHVAFDVTYNGYFAGPQAVSEHFEMTPENLHLTCELPGYTGPARLEWPVFSNNGQDKTKITVEGNTVADTFDGSSAETFTAEGTTSVTVGDTPYPNRNGWARLGRAEYNLAPPQNMGLLIKPEVKPLK